jgi:hypothetical protein
MFEVTVTIMARGIVLFPLWPPSGTNVEPRLGTLRRYTK